MVQAEKDINSVAANALGRIQLNPNVPNKLKKQQRNSEDYFINADKQGYVNGKNNYAFHVKKKQMIKKHRIQNFILNAIF